MYLILQNLENASKRINIPPFPNTPFSKTPETQISITYRCNIMLIFMALGKIFSVENQ